MTEAEIIERLPGDLRRIAEVIGAENAVALARRFRGTWLYMHSLDDFERELRNAEIRAAYDGGAKPQALAVKHGLCIRSIWNILGDAPEEEMPLLEMLKKDQPS